MRNDEVKTVELSEAEATLRLIAKLPAPEGLAERVRGRLGAAPLNAREDARVIAWPADARASRGRLSNWMRGAAAAAIVCVVAGGAWQISARIGMAPAGGGSAAAAPVHVRAAGGFASAGAMRTPETLNGPVLKKKLPSGKAADKATKKDGTAKKPIQAEPKE